VEHFRKAAGDGQNWSSDDSLNELWTDSLHTRQPLQNAHANAGDWLFPPSVLSDLIANNVDLPALGHGLKLRPLHRMDYHRGFLPLLGQLTDVGTVSQTQFETRFHSMANTKPHSYYVMVVEEMGTEKVVASATLVLEWKFIHSAGFRSRIEDVVVDGSMRGRHLGVLLNRYLVALARHLGAYKLSLECKDKLIGFYEQFGLRCDEGNNFMVLRFEPKPKI